MTTETLSNSLTSVAEFFETPEFRDGAALRSATVAELARMFRDMAGAAIRLEMAAKARRGAQEGAFETIARAVRTPGSNVELFPVIPRAVPPSDPKPAA